MASEVDRWWKLSSRRRRVVLLATTGSGLVAFGITGVATRWSDWLDVLGVVCAVCGIASLLAMIGAPTIGDRPGWKNPVPRLDGRTKRRALRCIRHGNVADAPGDVDLEQFAFYWGRSQTRSLRMAVPLALILVGGVMTDTDGWLQVLRASFVVFSLLSSVSRSVTFGCVAASWPWSPDRREWAK